MAYTVLPTVNTGDAWTASNHNVYIKDNFAAGVPDIFTTAGDIAYATAADAATRLGIGALSDVLVSTGTAPRWSSTGVTASSGFARNINLSNTLTAEANADNMQQMNINGVWAKGTFTSLTAAGLVVAGASWTATGAGTIANAYGVYISVPTIGTANWSLYVASGSSVIAGGADSSTSGVAYIGDSANAFMTKGLTINIGLAGTTEAIAIKSSDIAHGMTSLSETDTGATIYTTSSGGLYSRGLSEGAIAQLLIANYTTGDTSKSTASQGPFFLIARKKSGTSETAMGANENLAVFYNDTSCKFIFDAEGDSHEDGTGWTAYDDFDDLALLNALDKTLDARTRDPLREATGEWLSENKQLLEKARIVTFNDDTNGVPFINKSRLGMLLVGALRQQASKIAALENALTETRALIAGA